MGENERKLVEPNTCRLILTHFNFTRQFTKNFEIQVQNLYESSRARLVENKKNSK